MMERFIRDDFENICSYTVEEAKSAERPPREVNVKWIKAFPNRFACQFPFFSY